MALQLIIGRAGAGKSYMMYHQMTQASMKAPKENFIAVVPEQYSMETQKEILTIHPNQGSFNIEVTSFVRLAYTVFEEQGYNDFQVMDDLGKTLVMRKILEDCKDDLMLYSKKVSMPGFAEKMITVISELKQYGISQDALEDMANQSKDRPLLQQKLKDIYTINHNFNNYIAEKIITPEDVLHILCQNIPQSKLVENTHFYFDGYTGFTPAQYKVIDLLISYAKDVTVAITLPEQESGFVTWDEYELFALSKETISKLRKLARDKQVEEKPVMIAQEGSAPYRIKDNPSLCHIEANIFRNKRAEKISNKDNAIEIYSTSNPRKEAELVARKIADLVINNQYRYKDIAVVTGDMGNYYRYIEEEFVKCGIPAFIDHKKQITANAYVDGIIAALEVIEKDFNYDSVFRFLKLGITGIGNNSLDIFDNYVLRTGRKGYKSYCQMWEKSFRDMPEEQLDIVNQVRLDFLDVIEPLRQVVKEKDSTIECVTKAVYQLILDLDFQMKLDEFVQYFIEHNMPAMAKEYGQVYDAIISVLEKLVSLMGDEIIDIAEYKQILMAGFENIKVGIIPPGLDMVMVGDIERTRLKDIKKIVFIMGVNDGVIPKAGGGNGVITDSDREFLGQHNFILAPTVKDNIFKQKLYLYSLFAKPTSKLVFTFSKMANDATVLRKSYLIDDILRLFNDVIVNEDEETITEPKDVINKSVAAKYVAENFRAYRWHQDDKLFKQLNTILLDDEEYKDIVEMMANGAYYKINNQVLDKANARRLYGAKDNIKVTALEQYVACPFSQFIKNGLRLKERPKYVIEGFDIGNLYHSSIDAYFKYVGENSIDWKAITTQQSHEIMTGCVENTIAEYENDAFDASAKNVFLKSQILNIALKNVDVLLEHIKAGDFVPAAYELNVRSGRVDRVDLAWVDDKIYVKVIDYKSSDKKFSLDRVYEGADLQLMMYLKDCVEYYSSIYKDKEVIPAGAFYFIIQDPYTEISDFKKEIASYRETHIDTVFSDDEIKEIIVKEAKAKEYKLRGLVDDNKDVVIMMDNNLQSGNSKILPVSIKKDGDWSANSNVINQKLYGALLEHVSNQTDVFREEIINGKIDVAPINGSCKYCAYNGICGFDTRLGGKYRDIMEHPIAEIENELLGD